MAKYFKRGIVWAAVFALTLVSIALPARAFRGGDGSSGTPYLITDCADLQSMANHLSAHYKLAQTIDCNGFSFTAVGDSTTPFTGTLDGDNHAISNLEINAAGGHDIGIFGNTSNASITNVRLLNVQVTGGSQVGTLLGSGSSTQISGVSADADSLTESSSGNNIGGLVGELSGGSIDKSFANAFVDGAGNNVGGLVGYTIGPVSVEDSYSAAINITGSSYVGGLIGQVDTGPVFISNVYASGAIMSATSQVGGLIGKVASTATVTNAFTTTLIIPPATTVGGAFGTQLGSATNIYFDLNHSQQSSCTGSGSASCTGVNPDGTDNDHFRSNHSVAPLTSWDFTNIWYTRSSDTPSLRPSAMPALQCEPSIVTDTTVRARCGLEYIPDGISNTWSIQYSIKDTDDWHSLPDQNGGTFDVTTTDLLPGTSYYVRFQGTNALGTTPQGKVEALTTGPSDYDNDGVDNKTEATSPNSGDANNDGTADWQQANVTSLASSVSHKNVALQTSCTSNTGAQVAAESDNQADAAFDYTAGLLAFTAHGCMIGGTATITVYFYGDYDASKFALRKFNASTGAYTAIPNATLTNMSIGNQSVLKAVYQVQDGGNLDQDSTANGVIVDPVGLGTAVVGAPNTGVVK